MNNFYNQMVLDMIDESEKGVFDSDGLDDIVGVLSNGESDRVILHDYDENLDNDENEDYYEEEDF